MMPEKAPWDEIAIPHEDHNVRLVTADTAVPCFWGRDTAGNCLFILELQGDHATQYRRDAVVVRGIDTDLRSGESGTQHLVLTLQRHIDRDLFEGLCRTMISSLVHAGDSASSLALALAHIRRWKAFLSGSGHHLSAGEVRGLFAELSFLHEMIDRGLPDRAAIESWVGSEQAHQDFIFGNTAVEIKALSGAERNSVRISSEDQLESLNDALYLRIYRLSILDAAPGAHSLNQLVALIMDRLDEAQAIEAFEQKLVARGYAPLPEYDAPFLVVSELRSYRVGDGFPRLVRSGMPQGVMNVAYDLALEALAPYECPHDAMHGCS
jgi:hypothetical protein